MVITLFLILKTGTQNWTPYKNIDVFPIVSILLSLNLIRENSNYFLELGRQVLNRSAKI